MTTLHRRLLDFAVERFTPYSDALRGQSICITGASGFLAASLVAFLSQLDETAGLGIKLFVNARRPITSVPLFRFLKATPNAEWSITSVEDLVLPNVDNLTVIHTASYGSPSDYLREPIATFTANTNAIVNLFGQGRRFRQFIYFSSAEVYGQPDEAHIPTAETYIGCLDTLSPRSIYGESKRMGEVLGASLSSSANTPFTAIRPWNVYGPGQRLDDGRVPIDFIRQALERGSIRLSSNGKPSRSFCHVWDAIAQITATIGTNPCTKAFNIGNGSEEISILDTAKACATACGLSTGAVSFDEGAHSAGLQRCAPDISAVLALDGAPSDPTPLQTGLVTLSDWCRFLTSQ